MKASKSSGLHRPWWLLPLGQLDWRYWIPVAIAVFGIDYLLGPDPVFPVLYCFAIFPCAWYSGAVAGLTFAAVVPLVHSAYLLTAWAPQDPFTVVATLFRGIFVALVTLWIARFAEHERAVERHVRTLEGLLPICAFCKSIRNDAGQWERLETYISDRSEALFSHGFCPECTKIHYPEIELSDAAKH